MRCNCGGWRAVAPLADPYSFAWSCPDCGDGFLSWRRDVPVVYRKG